LRFTVDPELALFGESLRGALAGWEAPFEPALAEWQDDRDDALAERLRAAGWEGLWAEAELLGPAVAGGLELGRAIAPLCLVDEATLGAPLALEGRVRHGEGALQAALVSATGVRLVAIAEPVREATLDGSGTIRFRLDGDPAPEADGSARLQAWSAATLAYLAGLAQGSLDRAVAHVQARTQFGAPLAALPSVQHRLADAALATDGLLLVAWQAAGGVDGEHQHPVPVDSLLWAGHACREVTVAGQQVHGAIGFALESGVHRAFRRAKSAQVWADAVCRAVREDPGTRPPR
jgi:hypothetical protein